MWRNRLNHLSVKGCCLSFHTRFNNGNGDYLSLNHLSVKGCCLSVWWNLTLGGLLWLVSITFRLKGAVWAVEFAVRFTEAMQSLNHLSVKGCCLSARSTNPLAGGLKTVSITFRLKGAVWETLKNQIMSLLGSLNHLSVKGCCLSKLEEEYAKTYCEVSITFRLKGAVWEDWRRG